MLHRTYLFNPDGPDLRLKAAEKWVLPAWMTRLRMVVPRSLCTFYRIRCSGVPKLKLFDFARLQTQALSPFVTYGSAAVRQGQWLYLWLWDGALEIDFANKHRVEQHSFSVLPQSMFTRPINDGVTGHAENGSKGVEFLLWKGKLLQDSLWFPQQPTKEEWASLVANTPELTHLGWPVELPMEHLSWQQFQSQPWARNLASRTSTSLALNWNAIAPTMLSVASIGLVGWSTALYSQKLTYQREIGNLTQNQEQRLAALEPVQQSRHRAQQVIEWVRSVQALIAPQPVHTLINDLAPLITRQGLVVRELDINPPTVQTTLTSPSGNSPRFTAVLGALESKPYIYDARFVDVTGVMGFKFSWRLREPTAQISPEVAR